MLRAILTAGLAGFLATSSASANEPALQPHQAREDLSALYTGLQQAHYDLYAQTPRAVFHQRFAELNEAYDAPVSRARLHRDFQRFTALAGHAHARIEGLNPGFFDYLDAGGRLLPVSFEVRAGEVVVTGASEASGLAPGDRILSLNGQPNAVWLARLTRHIPAETPELAYSQLSQGAPYFIWLEFGAQDRFTLQVQRNGRRREVVVEAAGYEDTISAMGAASGPDLSGRDARMLSEEIAYLRPGRFSNTAAETQAEAYAPQSLAEHVAWVDESFETFIEAGATSLILDLRNNPGGSNAWSDPIVAWFADRPFQFASSFRVRVSEQAIAANAARLEGRSPEEAGVSGQLARLYADSEIGDVVTMPIDIVEPRTGRRFGGEVYALINAQSFSNAATTAALIQDYGFGTVIGEPTTDMATTCAAMETFTLPHSGFEVAFPKAHIIRPSGREDLHPVTPDVELSGDQSDAGTDPLPSETFSIIQTR